MLAAALLLDAVLGEPKWLWSRLPHPVVLIGRLIDRLDRACNRGRWRRPKGLLALGGAICGEDFRETGRTLESLGLAEMSHAEMAAMLAAGPT